MAPYVTLPVIPTELARLSENFNQLREGIFQETSLFIFYSDQKYRPLQLNAFHALLRGISNEKTFVWIRWGVRLYG